MTVEHPVVVITGAGAGIGRACAVRFAREGARVVVVDRTDADGQKTAELLKSMGAKALFVHADVSSEDQCRRFAEAACDAFGRIDVLVANAGVRVFGTILESTEADWDKILGVWKFSFYFLLQFFFEFLVCRNPSGKHYCFCVIFFCCFYGF